VLAPAADPVTPLLSTLRSELGAEFDVQWLTLGADSSPGEIATALATTKPQAVVLIDNSSVQLYAPIARALPAPPPAIIVMASFVEQLQKNVPNSTAIAFETPAVTTLSTLRRMLGRPLGRAGVIYRAGFEAFVERERERARPEQIELVPIVVPATPSVASLSRALRHLEHERVDAVWLSNDNVLLSRRFLSKAWLPFAKKTQLPIVAGVPGLVRSSVPFATYAAVPDLVGLGVQTADVIFALQKSGWRMAEPAVQPPVAVKTYLNLAQARAFGLRAEDEGRVDVLIQPGEP
jgi:putative ABC transport system substrate-binding protein